MSETVLVSEKQSDEYVELSSKAGKKFRKMILKMNSSFVHPKNPAKRVTIDRDFADSLVRNFKNGICDTVQFPLVDEKNHHVEDPARNLGQVVDLTYDERGVYATIDVRKDADSIGSTVLGASAMMSLDYTDTESGEKVGPTLLHVAGTNRPYLTKLDPFEEVSLSNTDTSIDEIVLLSEDETTETKDVEMVPQTESVEEQQPAAVEGESAPVAEASADEKTVVAEKPAAVEVEETVADAESAAEPEDAKTAEEVVDADASAETAKMTKDEMLAALKEEHGIDVEALMSEDKNGKGLVTALSNVLRSSGSDVIALSNSDDDITVAEIAQGVVALSRENISLREDNVELSARVEEFRETVAENEVDKAIKDGLIAPAKRDVMLKLRLSNADIYNELLPESPIIALSETGVTVHEVTPNKPLDTLEDEVSRLAKTMETLG